MQWLSQNWIWIAVAVGGFYFMTRMHRGGMGRSMGRGGDESADRGTGPAAVFDPVSRRAVAAGGISSIYHGRAFYFENRENRDAFEADSEKYVAGAPTAGQAIGSESEYNRPRRRRGGC
jgi:YHS domain-containing protein